MRLPIPHRSRSSSSNSRPGSSSTRNTTNPLGDVYGNLIESNQIVPTLATSKGIYLDTLIADTTHFGSFNFNRYLDRVITTVGDLLTKDHDAGGLGFGTVGSSAIVAATVVVLVVVAHVRQRPARVDPTRSPRSSLTAFESC